MLSALCESGESLWDREPTERLPRFIDSLQYIPLFPCFNCTLLFQLNAELVSLVSK